MMRIGMLFAGQGSQTVGMGREFYADEEAFRSVFDLLPEYQKDIAFNGSEEALRDTRNTQPVMVAFALGVYRCLEKAGVRPEMAAGLSLGEYSALGAAGVFDPETAITLVSKRAQEMERAGRGIKCGMTAVIGAERELVLSCCEDAAAEGIVQVANYNCPGQIVIAGEKSAVEKAAEMASVRGARRCIPLPVSGPFHTAFMKSAGEALAEILADVEFKEGAFPVIHNVTGRPLDDGESVAETLTRQVSNSVYFEDSIRYMLGRGIDTFIEIGPGRALSGFVRKISRDVSTYQVETPEEMAKVTAAVSAAKGVETIDSAAESGSAVKDNSSAEVKGE